MRFLYSTTLYLLSPLVFARLLWRSLRAPDYRRRWVERLGIFLAPETGGAIWVHAVSVGEVQAAVPLVRALAQRNPGVPVLITTMTPTGSRRVRELFGDEVLHVYVPYDLPGAVRRFLRRVRPRVAIVMETELWPNLFHRCRERGVPVVVANARLSERSAAGYRRVTALIRATLRDVSVIAAQTQADADRFESLGAAPGSLRVTGSVKFDLNLTASLREQAEVLRRGLGSSRPVWIAASTREGEEEPVLEAFARVRDAVPDTLLVLVPRHPERFGRVASQCRRQGLEVVLRSEGGACTDSTHVYLGDTLGELPVMYAAADTAFVGGSLVPAGGHNPLEPAALGLPVIFGPYTYNFLEIAERLLEVDGARRVRSAAELAEVVVTFLRDANLRHTVGENGRQFVQRNKGARDRLLAIVEELGANVDRRAQRAN
ncbi:MAG: 3-deoxy-D-manno-octulosonic acid transferase [Gammaproteobacteria bacterium]|nr:3-deoxy-D-manno-octulosonic acid transferase [Gammaproteobacteria bacterium]NIR28887.1 3-deoxy-D-manno-octulosonic acid transferase [Gammaproteobacteria bacterium]NIR97283.1 3-deoxy-D-manno-octulosonic acid transferase [Gammaproteobacteria bacterium]NIT62983.1 3-deoxy-D-manno-octulosonic acid transferase [Gammaproteobacteria bacterium]NIV19942.1 3-deoxy-D-manno-octulosonic acid transferase [Gammaproteobacteria bacterium]